MRLMCCMKYIVKDATPVVSQFLELSQNANENFQIRPSASTTAFGQENFAQKNNSAFGNLSGPEESENSSVCSNQLSYSFGSLEGLVKQPLKPTKSFYQHSPNDMFTFTCPELGGHVVNQESSESSKQSSQNQSFSFGSLSGLVKEPLKSKENFHQRSDSFEFACPKVGGPVVKQVSLESSKQSSHSQSSGSLSGSVTSSPTGCQKQDFNFPFPKTGFQL